MKQLPDKPGKHFAIAGLSFGIIGLATLAASLVFSALFLYRYQTPDAKVVMRVLLFFSAAQLVLWSCFGQHFSRRAQQAGQQNNLQKFAHIANRIGMIGAVASFLLFVCL